MAGETAVITSKGQVVIPVRLRRSLGLEKGTVVVFVEDAGRLILQPMTPDVVKRLADRRGARKVKHKP
jgi:AbrB family looped-hinge helix DNA binding protein